MDLSENAENLKGVGPEIAKKLAILKIKTVGDLINYYPKRYEDYSKITTISAMKPGENVTLRGFVKQSSGRYVRRGMHITEAVLSDDTGSVKLVWFNQPYRAASLKNNKTYYISGVFEYSNSRLSIINPSAELESSFQINTARIIPIYRETKGLKSGTIRKIIAEIVPEINILPEILPTSIVEENNLMARSEAIYNLHFPKSSEHLEMAKTRLGFEELFSLILAGLINKQQFAKESGVKIEFAESLAREFTKSLPFELTNAQRRVVWQIYKDIASTSPMNRLVEGDVGSGKTVVAAMSALMALKHGYQVALMAPTEILAHQHLQTMSKLMSNTKYANSLAFLVGSLTNKEKNKIKTEIKKSRRNFIIGTHALITDDVELKNLGMVIIDEQHRFGVEQRKKLQAKAGKMPHILSMTATPIPRTLALTIYGDLDVSIIDEMPPGRTPIKTKLVSPDSKTAMYDKLKTHLQNKEQIFFVCPLIEESDKLNVLSAEKVYEELSTKVYTRQKIGLLHGKLKSIEKDRIMKEFVDGKLDILVSTTVIEVGVDVPNATVMVIEGADRFGLAQIHQLRGRVGRGAKPGFCYLVSSDSKAPSRRLRALENTTDGFKLAELDLEIRGPGAIYGNVQSGQIDLRIADISDVKLISMARNSASKFLDGAEKLSSFRELEAMVRHNRAITNLN